MQSKLVRSITQRINPWISGNIRIKKFIDGLVISSIKTVIVEQLEAAVLFLQIEPSHSYQKKQDVLLKIEDNIGGVPILVQIILFI